MSFEGYYQYICVDGHQCSGDIWSLGDGKECPECWCCAPFEFEHMVDQTNGIVEDDPSTFAAPMKEVGFTDTWRTDHYGNKYATKTRTYVPEGSEWKRLVRTDD